MCAHHPMRHFPYQERHTLGSNAEVSRAPTHVYHSKRPLHEQDRKSKQIFKSRILQIVQQAYNRGRGLNESTRTWDAATFHSRIPELATTMSSIPPSSTSPVPVPRSLLPKQGTQLTHSVHMETHKVHCTAREAELYFLMGFRRVESHGAKAGGGIVGLG